MNEETKTTIANKAKEGVEGAKKWWDGASVAKRICVSAAVVLAIFLLPKFIGKVKDKSELTAEFNGHTGLQLWKDGPYWADRNLGAIEEIEGFAFPQIDNGCSYWWGDTVGYRYKNGSWQASNGSSSGFSFDEKNARTYGKDIATLRSEGLITAENVLAPKHDAAQAQWGGGWRMPTTQELNDLCKNCIWVWVEREERRGYHILGKGAYCNASIFLPAAGGGEGTGPLSEDGRNDVGLYGYYWSSNPDSLNGASCLMFCEGSTKSERQARYSGLKLSKEEEAQVESIPDLSCRGIPRSYGVSIRPVHDPVKAK